MRRLRCLAVALLVAVTTGCGVRDAALVEPAPEPAAEPLVEDRSKPLAVLTRAVERELGQPLRLQVDELRSDERWAFVSGAPRTAAGEPVDHATTKFAERLRQGEFDDGFCALLEKRDAGWEVVALEIGATDVPFVDWPARHGVPEAIVMP